MQIEATQDVERIAKALYEVVRGPWDWETVAECYKVKWRGYVTTLLHRDVIRVGARPPRIEQPIRGQTTIEEQLDPFALEDACDADD